MMKQEPEPITRKELYIDTLQCKKAALKIRAINHKLRQALLMYIHKNGPIQVTAIYQGLNLEQSVASQHLALLRRGKLVLTKREGKFIYYSVNYKQVEEVQERLRELVKQG